MRPGKKTRQRGGDNSYWTSYSDMMAGMLFVFALILFAAVYQLVDLQQKKTVELQTKEAQLSTQQSLLIDQEAELKIKKNCWPRRRSPCSSSSRSWTKTGRRSPARRKAFLCSRARLKNRRRCWPPSRRRLTSSSA